MMYLFVLLVLRLPLTVISNTLTSFWSIALKCINGVNPRYHISSCWQMEYNQNPFDWIQWTSDKWIFPNKIHYDSLYNYILLTMLTSLDNWQKHIVLLCWKILFYSAEPTGAEWRIYALPHWVIIGLDNGMSPVQHQAIICIHAGLWTIAPLVTYFSETKINSKQFQLKKKLYPLTK